MKFMIFNTKANQKNDSQKLADISLNKDKSNELWSELDESSQAAVSGGNPLVLSAETTPKSGGFCPDPRVSGFTGIYTIGLS